MKNGFILYDNAVAVSIAEQRNVAESWVAAAPKNRRMKEVVVIEEIIETKKQRPAGETLTQ